MDHRLWIGAIRQNPTVGYVAPFYLMAESMRVHESADLDNLGPAAIEIRHVRRLLAAALDREDEKYLWKQVKKFIMIIKISQNGCAGSPFSHNSVDLANSSETRSIVKTWTTS
ncbi:hypothetical protein E4U35_003539 [Claviceps purpurea]|nr:hypothetical protein E4U35_003539 [Claviceps purpurea]